MSNTFGVTLGKILERDFDPLEEVAVKQGIIQPLLGKVGWDTEDINEVYPELPLTGGKVDYALRVDEKTLVLVEAKRWKASLTDGDERQLRDYCVASKPSPGLAVLTNGREWRFYLRPLQPRKGQEAELRQFLTFDITIHELGEVEENFRSYLAREVVENGDAVKAARKLFEEQQKKAALYALIDSAIDGAALKLPTIIAEEVANITGGNRPSEEDVERRILAREVKLIASSPEAKGRKRGNSR